MGKNGEVWVVGETGFVGKEHDSQYIMMLQERQHLGCCLFQMPDSNAVSV